MPREKPEDVQPVLHAAWDVVDVLNDMTNEEESRLPHGLVKAMRKLEESLCVRGDEEELADHIMGVQLEAEMRDPITPSDN